MGMMKKLPVFVLSTALLLPMSFPVYAANNEVAVQQTQSLTYEQALEKAFASSISLKNANDAIDRAFEVRQDIGSNIEYYPTGTGNGTKDAADRSKVKGLAQADVAWGTSKRKYELEKDNIIYSVKTAYNNVLQAKKQQELAEATAKNEEVQKVLASYKASEGIISQYELSQEEDKFESALKQKTVAAKALDDAYTKLNSLIGVSKDARFVLNDEPQFKPFNKDENELENDITYIVSNSNAVAMAEDQLKLKRMDVDLYTYNAGNTPYKASEIDVRTAANQVEDTKKKLSDAMRSMYYSIKQLEDQYKVLNINLNTAEETLKMAKIRYDAGIGIKADVTAAELAVLNIKKQIFDVVVKLDNLELAYQKPWTATGASS
jgi:outer membrane protein